MTVGHEHATCIRKLTDLNARLRRLGCHMQIPLPLTLPPWDEPEPDAAIVLGDYSDYTTRHPGAADVTCVIEVADSSLRRDRTIKLQGYAAAGIAYVIVNLPDRVIEVYTQPLNGKGYGKGNGKGNGKGGPARYGRMSTLIGGQAVELPAAGGKRLSVTARSLLP